MKIIIRNNFHSSESFVLTETTPVTLNEGQVKRLEQSLCGMDCACGSMWSENHTEIVGYEDCHFEPIYDDDRNIVGADLVESY